MIIAGAVAIVAALAVLGFVLLSGDDDGDALDSVVVTTTTEPGPDEATTTTITTTTTEGPPTVERLATSVVQIQLMLGGQIVCTGSGTILEADGTILTNSHVIAQTETCPHDTIAVGITDVPELPAQVLFGADLLVDDPNIDLAVIRIARRLDGTGTVSADFPIIDIGDSDALTLGSTVRVIGYPAVGGETITFTEGTISGFVTTPGTGDRSWLKTDTTISGGNSGGLAVNDQGQIVGIPTIVGTGTGRITDCRVVQDTNGDGQIDQNDSCIPVGGFINGIRPVNVALPLLAQARSAAPIDQGPPPGQTPAPVVDRPIVVDPVWATDVADGVATSEVVTVPSASPQICLTWTYRNVAPGTALRVQWFLNGQEVPEAGFEGVNQGADEGGFFACFTNDAGIGPGLFEAVWTVADQPVFAHGIYVGDDRAPLTITVDNQTGSDVCVVQFAPTGTLSFGLNRLRTLPLASGVPTTVGLASGSYTARVIDCDGLVRFEDSVGTDLGADTTLTVT